MEGQVLSGTVSKSMLAMVYQLIDLGVYKDRADIVRNGVRNELLKHRGLLIDTKNDG